MPMSWWVNGFQNMTFAMKPGSLLPLILLIYHKTRIFLVRVVREGGRDYNKTNKSWWNAIQCHFKRAQRSWSLRLHHMRFIVFYPFSSKNRLMISSAQITVFYPVEISAGIHREPSKHKRKEFAIRVWVSRQQRKMVFELGEREDWWCARGEKKLKERGRKSEGWGESERGKGME